jgi:hypothetical protein
LLFDRNHKVLLVRFGRAFTREVLEAMDPDFQPFGITGS